MIEEAATQSNLLRVRVAAAEIALATALTLACSVVVSKALHVLGSGDSLSLLDWLAWGAHIGVVSLILSWRIRPAMFLLVVFGLCSIAWHSAGSGDTCHCLGLLDRLGGSAPTVWAAAQGMAAALVLLLVPAQLKH